MASIFSNSRRVYLRPILTGLLLVSDLNHANTVVITNRSILVTAPTNVQVIHLDDQHRLEERLSQELSEDPSQAAALIQSYLSSAAGKRFQSDLAQAQQGLTDAWSLGIEKIPAVVVDRSYVIYGETDVAKAVERINQARGSSQ